MGLGQQLPTLTGENIKTLQAPHSRKKHSGCKFKNRNGGGVLLTYLI